MQVEYTIVADATDIPLGSYKCLIIGGRSVLLAHLAGGFAAVENRCSHAGSAFAGPILKGGQIACPVHGARFDLRTGVPKSAPAFLNIPVFPVRVENGKVAIAVPPAAEASAL